MLLEVAHGCEVSILAGVAPQNLQNGRDPVVFQGLNPGGAESPFGYTIPNLLIAETIETGGAFHQRLIKNSIKWEDGYILPPEAPVPR